MYINSLGYSYSVLICPHAHHKWSHKQMHVWAVGLSMIICMRSSSQIIRFYTSIHTQTDRELQGQTEHPSNFQQSIIINWLHEIHKHIRRLKVKRPLFRWQHEWVIESIAWHIGMADRNKLMGSSLQIEAAYCNTAIRNSSCSQMQQK